MTGPTVPASHLGDLRKAAELAACELLGRSVDRVIAGRFDFTPNAERPDLLDVEWTEVVRLDPADPVPPDMVTFAGNSDEPHAQATCRRVLPLAETREQAPAIAEFLDYWAAEMAQVRAAFAR